jgi:alanyl aminopeptidase
LSGARLAAAALAALLPAASFAEVPTGPLPRTVVPLHYALALEIDPEQDGFAGEVRIRVRSEAPTATIFLHGKGLAIASASATPAGRAPVALTSEEVHESGVLALRAVSALPAGEATLALSFHAPFSTQLESTYKVVVAGRAYVMTQFEPLAARKSFPCFDEPSFKTPWDVTLVVPDALVAVANTRELRSEPTPDGRRRVTFATSEPLPTYLIAWAVGPWDVVEAPAIPPTPQRPRPLALRGIAVAGRGPELAHALAETPRLVAALEDWFDLAYPFDKLDLLAAPDFAFGAMENAGLILYQDRLLLIDADAPTALRQAFFGIHAHELAHQWFGNWVTPRWWDDLWLNEAFATWLATKLSASLEPGFRAELRALEGVRAAMREDSLASSRRIAEPIADHRDVASAFDGVTYQKGAAVLGMFEAWLGAERFREGLRAHVRRFARGNATSADLMRSLAAFASDAKAFEAAFWSFLDQPGVPLLELALTCEERPTLHVAQRRHLPFGSRAPAAQAWGVPLCARLGKGDGSTKHCALAAGAQTKLALPAGCPDWVMPNADGAGYYRFALAARERAALDAASPRLSDLEQLAAADSFDAELGTGRLAPAEFLQALPRLAASRSWPAASVPVDSWRWLREQLARAEERPVLDALARRVYGPRLAALGLDERAGEPDEAKLERQALADLLARAGDSELRAELAARARAGLASGFDPAKLAPDLRQSALWLFAQDGGDADFAALEAALAAAEDMQLRRELVRALASALEPGRARRARALALDPALRASEVGLFLGAHFDWPENRAEGRAWFRENDDALFAGLPALSAPYAAWAYAAGACSEAEAGEVQERFAARLGRLEGGPRTLAQIDEAIRLCAALRAHHAGAGPLLSLE